MIVTKPSLQWGGTTEWETMTNQISRILEWMLDYEVRSSTRYDRDLAIVMMTTTDGKSVPQCVLGETLRGSDEFFNLEGSSAVLMGETNQEGALSAVERFGFCCDGSYDLRFSIASFPVDGDTAAELLSACNRRLNRAVTESESPVAIDG